jgi:urea carboxylase system permease
MSQTLSPDAGSQAERDTQHLASLGYKQELHRSLGLFSNFAVAFSYISVSTGTFSLFALGIGLGGPAFFWSWPIVAGGQFLVALCFAELASHYPVAGSIYQWSKRLASPGIGWFIGWFYLAATLLTVTAVAFTLPLTLDPIFKWDPGGVPSVHTGVTIALITLIITTAINISGVKIVSIINNIGVVAEIVGMFVFAIVLVIIGHHQSLGVFFQTQGTEHGPNAGAGYLGVFLAAMFMSLFVIFGFDTAGSLGEETVDPQREAPRGVLLSIGLSFFAGLLFLGAAVLAIKDVPKIMADPAALQDIILGAFGTNWGNVYLLVVSIAIFVCTLAIQASGIRLIFSMGRDGRLPFSAVWSSVYPALGTPVYAALAAGILAALPLIVSQQIAVIAIGATGLIYLSYFITNVVLLQARQRGWPERPAPFSLGSRGMLVNVLALVYGGAMLINFAWPRDATNPPLSVGFTRFTRHDFIVGGVPMFELTIAVLLIVGALYWFLVQRHRLEHVQAGHEARLTTSPAESGE